MIYICGASNLRSNPRSPGTITNSSAPFPPRKHLARNQLRAARWPRNDPAIPFDNSGDQQMNPFGRFTAADMEAQYNLRLLRPDYETAVVPDWIARSESSRKTLECKIGVAYGASAKQKLDIFH